MAMFKRWFLFALVNIAIIAMISIVISVLGLDRYLNYYGGQYGLNYQSLLIFCLVWGMVGSLISLALSKFTVKLIMGVETIDPNTTNPSLREIVDTVYRLAKSAGLSKMPEVGIYRSPEVNAFATGPTKNSSLVAVSEGLLRRLNKAELEGVIGHEISHITNGDMVTMTLIQGVVNAFVMFFARVLAFVLGQAMSKDNDRGPNPFVNMLLIIFFQIIFGLLGMMVVGYFSRIREFRADEGGAKVAGRPKMIAALEALKGTQQLIDTQHQSVASLKISGKPGRFYALMATHPPLEERIERLKKFNFV